MPKWLRKLVAFIRRVFTRKTVTDDAKKSIEKRPRRWSRSQRRRLQGKTVPRRTMIRRWQQTSVRGVAGLMDAGYTFWESWHWYKTNYQIPHYAVGPCLNACRNRLGYHKPWILEEKGRRGGIFDLPHVRGYKDVGLLEGFAE